MRLSIWKFSLDSRNGAELDWIGANRFPSHFPRYENLLDSVLSVWFLSLELREGTFK